MIQSDFIFILGSVALLSWWVYKSWWIV